MIAEQQVVCAQFNRRMGIEAGIDSMGKTFPACMKTDTQAVYDSDR